MGWVYAEVKQKLECSRLKNMPESRTAHNIHQWSLSLEHSWETTMLEVTKLHGYTINKLV